MSPQEYRDDHHRDNTFRRRQQRSRHYGDRLFRAYPDERVQPRSAGRTSRPYAYNRRSASPSDYDEDDDYDNNGRDQSRLERRRRGDRRRSTFRRS
jgi:hypothetical protein